MHSFSYYFATIFPKYWHMQGACCATHFTEMGKTPISVWEHCRENRMQDSASACRLDSTRPCRLGNTRKQWDGSNHHQVQCFQFTSCQTCTRFWEIITKKHLKKQSFLVYVKIPYINFYFSSLIYQILHICSGSTVICIFQSTLIILIRIHCICVIFQWLWLYISLYVHSNFKVCQRK